MTSFHIRNRHLLIYLALGILISGLLPLTNVQVRAAEFVVTKLADTSDGTCDSDCSLREAIAAAATDSTITFAGSLTGTITLAGTELLIDKHLTISGPGADVLAISGNLTSRVFNISYNINANISGLTITQGKADNGAAISSNNGTLVLNGVAIIANQTDAGMGALMINGGLLTLRDSEVSENVTTGGGCGGMSIATNATISPNYIINSTISGNSTTGGGGGMCIYPSTLVEVINSTVADNTNGSTGGGNILVLGGTSSLLTLKNALIGVGSITAQASPVKLVGPNLIAYTGNVNFTGDRLLLIEGDPLLQPLANNGGRTRTRRLNPTSLAIDSGWNSTCAEASINNLDQRGSTRPINYDDLGLPVCDLGALEMEYVPPAALPAPNTSLLVTKLADTNDGMCNADCSLIEAILAANRLTGITRITFAAGLSGTLSTSTTEGYVVRSDIQLIGPGAGVLLLDFQRRNHFYIDHASAFISGLTLSNGEDSAVVVAQSAMLTLDQMVIKNNQGRSGGGIASAGDVRVFRSAIVNNAAIGIDTSEGRGGGIISNGKLLVVNSIISGNSAYEGGGLWLGGNLSPANFPTLINSTVHNNTALNGAGILLYRPDFDIKVVLANSIIADNGMDNCTSTITSTSAFAVLGANLQFPNNSCGNAIPVANPLFTWGEEAGMPTLPLLPGSAAIDAGDNALCASVIVYNLDQVGNPRPRDGDGNGNAVCDLGAYEAPAGNPSTPTPMPTPIQALVVNKLADSDDGHCDPTDCSLREAISSASWNATITFASGLSGSITLTRQIVISKSLNIQGPGADVLTISGGNSVGILQLTREVQVHIENLRFANARTRSAIYVAINAVLTISRCWFQNNSVIDNFDQGAAIYNYGGRLQIYNSSFTHNAASGGAAIYNAFYATAMIANSPFTENSSLGGGAIINNNFSTMTLLYSTLARNIVVDNSNFRAANLYSIDDPARLATTYVQNTLIAEPIGEGDNCVGTITTLGNNLQYPGNSCGATIPVANPRLGTLGTYDDILPILPLLARSRAIDRGSDTECLSSPIFSRDQRLLLRPVDGNSDGIARCDIGAYEAAAGTTRPDTIGIYRPSTNMFYLRNSNSTGFSDINVSLVSLGMDPNEFRDVPVVGDWNGDGIDTVGFYRRGRVSDNAGAGLFVLSDSNVTPQADHVFVLGNPSDTPLVGDWDGNGTDSVGVFRPSNGLIYIKNALTTGFADFTMVLGNPGDVGIAGDWDDDGKDSPGVYRPGASPQFYLTNQVCNCVAFSDYNVTFGDPGDQPFTGDWNGDGRTGLGVYRTSNGLTYLRNDPTTTGFSDFNFVYGINGDYAFGGVWVAVGGGSSQIEIAPTFQP
ncbi:MAG: CSLREA domain-containing protein [Anaerolineae bacterium]|nr:CSLREA domain-containing protein [Anaerolineae bacterium]